VRVRVWRAEIFRKERNFWGLRVFRVSTIRGKILKFVSETPHFCARARGEREREKRE
jgi:hypothetical protein